MYVDVLCVFVFFKPKTAYEMRISDWSSDVCSSDLCGCRRRHNAAATSKERYQRRGKRLRDSDSNGVCIGHCRCVGDIDRIKVADLVIASHDVAGFDDSAGDAGHVIAREAGCCCVIEHGLRRQVIAIATAHEARRVKCGQVCSLLQIAMCVVHASDFDREHGCDQQWKKCDRHEHGCSALLSAVAGAGAADAVYPENSTTQHGSLVRC